MPDFAWVGLDTAGRERRGSVRAETQDAARARLAERRLYIVRLEPAAEGAGPPLLSRSLLARRRLSSRQLTLFTRQLATLIQVAPLEDGGPGLVHVFGGAPLGRMLSRIEAR